MAPSATFTLLPITRLEALCDAAEKGEVKSFAKSEGKTAAQFAGNGFVFGSVFAYLDQEHEINLSSSDYDEITGRLAEALGGAHFVFTEAHKAEHYTALDPANFEKTELLEFYEDFNEMESPGAGSTMHDAIRALRESLTRVDATRVVVLSIV